jgi:hypothetical protein
MTNPLINPIHDPTRIPATMAISIGAPAFATRPETTPPRAKTDPMDKSSPAIIKTSVVPVIEINANPEERKILKIFPLEINAPLTIETNPIYTTRAIITLLS